MTQVRVKLPLRQGPTLHVAGAIIELDEPTAQAFARVGRVELIEQPQRDFEGDAHASRKGKAR